MLRDAYVSPRVGTTRRVPREAAGVPYESAECSSAGFAELAAALVDGAPGLAALADGELLAAWDDTVACFRDPGSPERRALDAALAALCRLSPAGIAAGLEAVLGGVAGEPAARFLAEAGRRARGAAGGGPVLVVLAANLPGLAVQPLLPLLALRRPVLVKSPTAEPLFAPAFVARLAAREPRLAAAVAAVTWPGGDRTLEAPVLAAAERVIAYGEQATLDDLERRAPGRVTGYGPKTSLAVVAADAVDEATAAGLARDVALFDQRGCLSIVAVYTDGDAAALGRGLAAALAERAAAWPPGPPTPAEAAGVQQLRLEAALRGCDVLPVEETAAAGLTLAAGTVVVEDDPSFRPTPGLRSVRVHHLRALTALPAILAPWRGRLQGAAFAGAAAWSLADALAVLGVSRRAAPGDLQSPDALWHNGGIHPLDVLAPPVTPPPRSSPAPPPAPSSRRR